MPVYNSERYLERAIRSVLEQTYNDIELIIINDGSTDSSEAIINLYARRDSRIKVISQINTGVSAARNAGISMASGEWLFFMDADDYIDSCFFQDAIPYCELCDMIITGANRHYINNSKADKTIVPPNLDIYDEKEYVAFLGHILKDRSQDLVFNYMWNKLIRLSIINDNAIRFREDMSLGEDFFFNCDLLKHSIRIKTINKAYCHYCIHEDTSLVGRFYRQELERRRLVFQKIEELYRYYAAYENNKKELEIREGRFSYKSLSKIKNKSCDLTACEKIQYVKGFLKARKDFIANYLAQEGGVRNHIKRMIILSGNAKLVCMMFLRF